MSLVAVILLFLAFPASSPKPVETSRYHSRIVGNKVYLENSKGNLISPFHGIPLHAKDDGVLNMVVEIPRWSNPKLEISKKDFLNPIIQDTKNNMPRFLKNIYPFKGHICNYGAFPQTWEDPKHTTRFDVGEYNGDNDPLDVCEIGSGVAETGQVKQVKVLGLLAMIDDGETDWKIIAIDVNDPLAKQLSDIKDVEKQRPKFLGDIINWFRFYKYFDGSKHKLNKFAFNGEPQGKDFAIDVINQCHRAWNELMKENETNISVITTSNSIGFSDEPINIPDERLIKKEGAMSTADDKWYFIPNMTENQ